MHKNLCACPPVYYGPKISILCGYVPCAHKYVSTLCPSVNPVLSLYIQSDQKIETRFNFLHVGDVRQCKIQRVQNSVGITIILMKKLI